MLPHPVREGRVVGHVQPASSAAAERVREIMANAEKPYVALRVGVKNGGCAGQEYTFAYAETIEPLAKWFGLTSSARASFALYNTTEDADAFADALIKAREFFA